MSAWIVVLFELLGWLALSGEELPGKLEWDARASVCGPGLVPNAYHGHLLRQAYLDVEVQMLQKTGRLICGDFRVSNRKPAIPCQVPLFGLQSMEDQSRRCQTDSHVD